MIEPLRPRIPSPAGEEADADAGEEEDGGPIEALTAVLTGGSFCEVISSGTCGCVCVCVGARSCGEAAATAAAAAGAAPPSYIASALSLLSAARIAGEMGLTAGSGTGSRASGSLLGALLVAPLLVPLSPDALRSAAPPSIVTSSA